MKKLRFLLAIAIIFTMSAPLTVNAQIADQPCDTQFWRQMHARAWMEAEREIMQNKNLIFKPDSVLEYVCFDQFVGINAEDGGNIFVHTDYFGGQIIPRGAPNGLDYVLTQVVSNSLNQYRAENFAHPYLGGRASALNAASQNSVFRNADVPVNQYMCPVMSNVWRAAKCMNFIDNAAFENTDGFYPFDVIVGINGASDVDGYSGGIQDPRQWPSACGSISTTTPSGSNVTVNAPPFGTGGGWSDQIELATNTSTPELYPYQVPLGLVYTAVHDLTVPGGPASAPGGPPGSPTQQCSPPIATGIQVVTGNSVQPFADGVCTNPGCTYTRGNGNTLGTCN